jgi:hypothetical protein
MAIAYRRLDGRDLLAAPGDSCVLLSPREGDVLKRAPVAFELRVAFRTSLPSPVNATPSMRTFPNLGRFRVAFDSLGP